MPIFSYQALKAGKEIVRGEVTASNLKDARDVLRKMGLVPTQISEYVDTKTKKGQAVASLSLNDKIDFISTLQILLSSGLPAVESLMFMEQEAAKRKIRYSRCSFSLVLSFIFCDRAFIFQASFPY